jgi:5-methylcytosine-specific restriction endonuclease McrA
MRRSLSYLCRAPSCPAIIDKPGYCPAHRAGHSSSGAEGYGWRWKRTRDAFLASLGPDPRCARCGARGVPLDVHHKDGRGPLERGANLWSNFEPLCRSCHRFETTQAAKRRSAADETPPRSTPLT